MSLFTISGAAALLLGGGLCAGLFLLAVLLKYRFDHSSIAKTKEGTRTKYLEKDVFRHRPAFFKIGLITALSLLFIALSWTVYQPQTPDYNLGDGEPINVTVIPATIQKVPPPPPPPPSIELVDNETILMDTSNFASTDIQANQALTIPVALQRKQVRKSLPSPPALPEEPPIFFAEHMPYFGKCTEEEDRKICSDREVITFIAKHTVYTSMAKANNIEGTAVVRFVVEKDGSMTSLEVLRDPGGGLGQSALEAVQAMASSEITWHPGRQNGRFVRVMMTLPIKFELKN